MGKTIERYLGQVEALLPSGLDEALRQRLVNEAESHLYESATAYEELGHGADEAETLAVESYGRSREVVKGMRLPEGSRDDVILINSSMGVAALAALLLFHCEMVADAYGVAVPYQFCLWASIAIFAYAVGQAAWRVPRFRLDRWFIWGCAALGVLVFLNAPFWVDFGQIDGMNVSSAFPIWLGLGKEAMPVRTFGEQLYGSLIAMSQISGAAMGVSLAVILPVRLVRWLVDHIGPGRRGVKA